MNPINAGGGGAQGAGAGANAGANGTTQTPAQQLAQTEQTVIQNIFNIMQTLVLSHIGKS